MGWYDSMYDHLKNANQICLSGDCIGSDKKCAAPARFRQQKEIDGPNGDSWIRITPGSNSIADASQHKFRIDL